MDEKPRTRKDQIDTIILLALVNILLGMFAYWFSTYDFHNY